MKTAKHIKIFPALGALLFAAASCIYPFTPDYPDTDSRLVIEGDILIGEMTSVKLSYLGGLGTSKSPVPKADVQIESEDGRLYPPVPVLFGSGENISSVNIDMTDAPDNVRYRLKVHDLFNGHHYNSEWLDVMPPAYIDRLDHHLIDMYGNDLDIATAPSYATVAIALSMHCPDGSKYFRWSYKETWEYHSEYKATHYYIPPYSSMNGISTGAYGSIVEFAPGENIYYCWKTSDSDEIMLFTTEAQEENRFEDLTFHQISRSSQKLQEVYNIKVCLQALSEDGYRYWKNIEDNSTQQGSLFAPTPSSIRGNITCEENSDEMVIGYINAAKRAVRNLYIDNKDYRYYYSSKYSSDTYQDEPANVTKKEDWNSYYRKGFVPYTLELEEGLNLWLPSYCVDCRVKGGTKNKPAAWPRPEL